MGQNNIKKTGTPRIYKNSRGGATLITEPALGVVKNNIDDTRSGRIQVYIANYGGSDPNDSRSWLTVNYMSPWYGVTSPNGNIYNGQDSTGYGKFVGNPQSYGFWAAQPDIGTQVICVFVNGDPQQGYYIGCLPQPGLSHMVPAIAAAGDVVPNEGESTSYGGANRIPTTEVNYSNPAIRKSPTINTDAKPVHSYQASILFNQGLIRDDVRGVISSSAQRETPSRVFGMSTPGGPVYQGGYDNTTIRQAATSAGNDKLQIVGRTGGHSFVMDDGTIDGLDQLVRLRTSAGHQILMSDSGQTLFIMHANGQTWIEMGKEGTIDMFSTNSVNLRTQGDLNLHADRDINMHAKRNFNVYGESMKLETDKTMTQRVGTDFSGYTIGKHTQKVDGAMSFASSGVASYASSGVTYINGSKINLNTGSSSTVPATVPVITKVTHTDTEFSQAKGWISPGPSPLLSITSRLTTHYPYIGAGKGINIKVNATASTGTGEASPAVAATNANTPAVPQNPTTPAQVSQTPMPTATGNKLVDPNTAQVMASQQTVAAAALPESAKAAIAPGTAGATVQQIQAAGIIKPGAAAQVQRNLEKGMDINAAYSGLTTGAAGINNAVDLGRNPVVQTQAMAKSYEDAAQALVNNNIITGKEGQTQSAGIVYAAATVGLIAVANSTKSVNSALAPIGIAVAAAITQGKFAGQLAEKSKGGFSGLGTSISATVDSVKTGVGNTVDGASRGVSGLAASLKSTLRNAFDTVERSFTNLRAGVPNRLGQSQATSSTTAIESAGNTYDRSVQEVNAAETAYFAATKAYRNNPSTENSQALQRAEADWAGARKKQAQAANEFLKDNSIPDFATAGLPVTTLNSGLNALPGGAGAIISQNSNDVISGIQSNFPAELSPAALSQGTGGLVDRVKGAVTNIGTGASGFLAKIQTSLSSVGGNGETASPVQSTDTYSKTAQVAAATGLLGDSRVPIPSSVTSPPPVIASTAPEQKQAAQTAELDKLIAAKQEEKKQRLLIERLVAANNENPTPEFWLKYEKEWAKYEELQKKTAQAQTAYELTVYS